MADIDETIDIHSDGDFLPTMPAVYGRTALVQRLIRRLSTPTGRFPFWSPNAGFDLRDALLSKASPDFIITQVQFQCTEDEQVESCLAVMTKQTTTEWEMDVTITDAEGPFTFTLSISQARQELSARIREAA